MTRFYAISAMVDLFEARELQALASFAATPTGRSALAKLPALGAILTPLDERQMRMANAYGWLTELECARNETPPLDFYQARRLCVADDYANQMKNIAPDLAPLLPSIIARVGWGCGPWRTG